MTEWRHATGLGCVAAVPETSTRRLVEGRLVKMCGCTIPDPDPTSPCGLPGCGEALGGAIDSTNHPHVPTRCTCGHPIKAQR